MSVRIVVSRPRRNPFQRPRIRLRRDPVDGVLALHLGDLVIEVFPHLRRDALLIQRSIINRQPSRTRRPRLDRLTLDAFHAPRTSPKQQADLIVGAIALVVSVRRRADTPNNAASLSDAEEVRVGELMRAPEE